MKMDSLDMCSGCTETFYRLQHCPVFTFFPLNVYLKEFLPPVPEEVVITQEKMCWRDVCLPSSKLQQS